VWILELEAIRGVSVGDHGREYFWKFCDRVESHAAACRVAGFDTKVANRGVNGEYNPWPKTPKFDRLFICDLHPNSYGEMRQGGEFGWNRILGLCFRGGFRAVGVRLCGYARGGGSDEGIGPLQVCESHEIGIGGVKGCVRLYR